MEPDDGNKMKQKLFALFRNNDVVCGNKKGRATKRAYVSIMTHDLIIVAFLCISNSNWPDRVGYNSGSNRASNFKTRQARIFGFEITSTITP